MDNEQVFSSPRLIQVAEARRLLDEGWIIKIEDNVPTLTYAFWFWKHRPTSSSPSPEVCRMIVHYEKISMPTLQVFSKPAVGLSLREPEEFRRFFEALEQLEAS